MTFHILTEQELTELTGYTTPSKQREVLLRNGIHFIEGKGGRIRTTSENIRYPLRALASQQHAHADEGFNLEAI